MAARSPAHFLHLAVFPGSDGPLTAFLRRPRGIHQNRREGSPRVSEAEILPLNALHRFLSTYPYAISRFSHHYIGGVVLWVMYCNGTTGDNYRDGLPGKKNKEGWRGLGKQIGAALLAGKDPPATFSCWRKNNNLWPTHATGI